MNEKLCREVVRARSDGCCEICGERRGDTMHHRLTRKYGPWDPTNIVLLCGDGTRKCHGRVTNTRDIYYDFGWLIRTWDKRAPGEIPFLHWGWGYVLLDPVGDYHMVDTPEVVA
jgi:5-methylcytosine-specific restriction endonuclease McrA